MPRIGLLWIETGSDSKVVAALREGLSAHGYIDGKNIQIDKHLLVDRYDRLADAADRLVNQKVDVILSYGSTATRAASKATTTIPIVMVIGNDLVQLGVVATLSKPGRNVTGVTFVDRELIGKRLEILRELVPGIRRVGVLLNPDGAAEATAMITWEAAARTLSLEAQRIEVRAPSEIDAVISEAARRGVDSLAPRILRSVRVTV